MRILIIAILLCAIFGCTAHHGKLTILSSRPVDLKKTYTKRPSPASGEDVWREIILVPLGHTQLNAAVENALKTEDASYLTDVDIYMRFWQIPVIYYERHLEITGTAWREKK